MIFAAKISSYQIASKCQKIYPLITFFNIYNHQGQKPFKLRTKKISLIFVKKMKSNSIKGFKNDKETKF